MQNEDIVPGLLAAIEEDFKKSFQSDDTLKTLYAKVESGEATQADGERFAHELGKLTAEVFHRNVTPEDLPNGMMYHNIASRIIPPSMTQNYELVCEVMRQIIEIQNKEAGLGIKFQMPEFDKFSTNNLVWAASSDEYEKTRGMVERGVDTHTRRVANDCVKTNAEFQHDSGLDVKIIRDTDGDCCQWCSDLADTYDFDKAPSNVWAMHDNCGCTVEYGSSRNRSGSGGKRWTSETESAMMKTGEGGDADLSPDKLEALKMGKPKVDKDKIPLGDYAGTVSRETTKEERAMLLQYALERGVNLQGVKEFDGDIELAKAAIDTMAKWQEMMPCKDRVSIGFFYMNPADFGETDRYGVGTRINSLSLRDREVTERNINNDPLQFASQVFEDVVAHEYAHAYVNSHLISIDSVVEMAEQAYREIGSPGDEFLEFMASHISRYSIVTSGEDNGDDNVMEKKLGEEFHSEIFARHNSNPSEFTTIFIRLMKERGNLS